MKKVIILFLIVFSTHTNADIRIWYMNCELGAKRYATFATFVGKGTYEITTTTKPNSESRRLLINQLNMIIEDLTVKDDQLNSEVVKESIKRGESHLDAFFYREMMEISRNFARNLGYKHLNKTEDFYQTKIDEECRKTYKQKR